MNGVRDFPLAPLGKAARVTVVAIGALPLLAVAVGAAFGTGPGQDWTGFVAVLLCVVAIVVMLSVLMARRKLGFDGERLVIKGALYTRRVPLERLDLDAARIVDLAEHTALKPLLRMNGMSVPGFHVGHYRLRDHSRAFCLLTATDRVLVLPERDGLIYLLSPERPQALLDDLRRQVIPAG